MTEEIKNLDIENQIEDEDDDNSSLADDIAKLKRENEGRTDSVNNTEDDERPESEVEIEQDKDEPSEEEKLRLQRAQEDYKKRQEERRRANLNQPQAKYEEQSKEVIANADKEALEFVKQFQKQQIFEQNIKKAEVELTNLEGEFKVAYPDYEDKVNQALKLTKYRLVNEGMSELDADRLLKREKILLADRAAASGKDPVEAVYNEAKGILAVFERYAEEMGYSKGKKKTNLQALRESAKPNAMSGGTGRGAIAARKTYDDMEGDEIDELSLGQMLRGGI